MSLNWDLTKIQDHQTLCWEVYWGADDKTVEDRLEELKGLVDQVSFMGPDWQWWDPSKTSVCRLHPTTQTLIFATVSVGIGEITRKNVGEFFRRLNMLETSDGAYRQVRKGNEIEPLLFTLEEVEDHIGLVVNVTNVPKGKWERKFFAQNR